MERRKLKALFVFAERIRIIRFTCSFCGLRDDYERADFTDKRIAEILFGAGWEMVRVNEHLALSCPRCLEKIVGKNIEKTE